MSFESEFVILDSNENTVTFHLSSIYLQMSLTENTSKNYGWAKSDTLFNQRLDRNQLPREIIGQLLTQIIDKSSMLM